MTMVTCTRPSTLSSALDDKGGLIPYAASTALKTVALNPDLLTRLSLLPATAQDPDHWRSYKGLYDEADKRGGGREASDGTNIHSVVQALAMGADVSTIPEPARSDGIAVWNKLKEMGIQIVASEQFVYCEGLPEPCAGTLDMMGKFVEVPKHFVLDVKSVGEAKDAKYSAMKWSMQTAIYALGRPYPHPYRRDRWDRPIIDTDKVEDWGFEVNQDHALIMQVVRGQAEVTPVWVNLDYGREWARLACRVRAERKRAPEALEPGEHPFRGELINTLRRSAEFGGFDELIAALREVGM